MVYEKIDKPVEPGWYWYAKPLGCGVLSSKIEPRQVHAKDGRLVHYPGWMHCTEVHSSDVWFGQWYGPRINEPVEIGVKFAETFKVPEPVNNNIPSPGFVKACEKMMANIVDPETGLVATFRKKEGVHDAD